MLYSRLTAKLSVVWLSAALPVKEIVLFTSRLSAVEVSASAGADNVTVGALLSKTRLNIPRLVEFPALSVTVTVAEPLANCSAGIVIE